MNFTQTLLKRLPDIVDGNPVKMALSLAHAIVEITGVCSHFSLMAISDLLGPRKSGITWTRWTNTSHPPGRSYRS